MDLIEAMEKRRSVRSYTDKPITGKDKEELQAYIDKCSQGSIPAGLHWIVALNISKDAVKKNI